MNGDAVVVGWFGGSGDQTSDAKSFSADDFKSGMAAWQGAGQVIASSAVAATLSCRHGQVHRRNGG